MVNDKQKDLFFEKPMPPINKIQLTQLGKSFNYEKGKIVIKNSKDGTETIFLQFNAPDSSEKDSFDFSDSKSE